MKQKKVNFLNSLSRVIDGNPNAFSKKSSSSSTSSTFNKRKLSELPKRESSMSLCSSTSIESDWSDEELEEVIFADASSSSILYFFLKLYHLV